MKKRSIKSYADLPSNLIKKIDSEYPYGFDEELFEVKGEGKNSYKAMWFETDDVLYLIKFDKYLNTRAKELEKDDDDDEDEDLTMDNDESENVKLDSIDDDIDEDENVDDDEDEDEDDEYDEDDD